MARLLSLLGAWPALLGEAQDVSFPQATLIDGCVYKHARYYSPTSVRTETRTWRECQAACVKSTEIACAYFGFYPDVGTCYLTGADAAFTDYLSHGSYSGPAVCPSRPDFCTTTIVGEYPAAHGEASKQAWKDHVIPNKLACWPKNFKDKKYENCPSMSILEDTETGWPGKCLGLKQVVVPYGETCSSWCTKQVSCSVWQEIKDPDPYKPVLCFQTFWSAARSCYTRTLANGTQDFRFKPTRAQRLMRGEVRVLKHLAYAEVDGLTKVFDENYFAKEEDAAQACRSACYSDLGCQWWYYNQVKGCFVEDISQEAVPVPLTLSHYRNSSKTASQVLHGEYIQHVCKEAGDAAVSSHEVIPDYVPTTTPTIPPYEIPSSTSAISAVSTPAPVLPPKPAAASPVGKEGKTARAIAKEEVNLESLFAVGALTAVGVDLNQIPDGVREELRERLAELISANTGVGKFDVLDMGNEAGKTSLTSWQPHNPIFARRLQTVEPAISAQFKLLNPKGTETLESVRKSLQSSSFQGQMSSEMMMVLKRAPSALQPPGRPPRVQAHVRETNLDDIFPEGMAPKVTKHNHFQTWIVVLGLALVAAIAALASWVYCTAAPMGRKKVVSFDGEDDMAKLKGSGEDWERSAREMQVANSPSRRKIQEAELRAQQMASDLAQDLDNSKPFPQGFQQSGGFSGYGQSGYGQSALPPPPPLLTPSLQQPAGLYPYGAQPANPAQVRVIRG